LAAIAFAAKGFWGYAPEQLERWREDLSPTPESLRSEPTFVAEIDGELAGFYQLRTGEPQTALEHLWVHPGFMRRGVGRALLAHAVALAAGRGISELSIDSEPHAEPFYLAHGAVRVGLRSAPIEGHPERALPQLLLSTSPPDRARPTTPN
jgi:GNAT superfamily N-acetyltransferase